MSQSVDIFSMLCSAQSDYQQTIQQKDSVAAFFQRAQNGNGSQNQSLPIPIINNVSSLEQIERGFKGSSPQSPNELAGSQQDKNLTNSLAQFFNKGKGQNPGVVPPPESAPAPVVVNQRKEKQIGSGRVPPGFSSKVPPKVVNKSKQLITPTMLSQTQNGANANNNGIANEVKKPAAEPLTKNQLLQAMNYLLANDDEFMFKVHEAYVKSFKGMSS